MRYKQRIMISDSYLVANTSNADAVIDCFLLTPSEAFVNTAIPKGSKNMTPDAISCDMGAGGATDTYAAIKCKYESDADARIEYFLTKETHKCRVRYIYPKDTTARGINLKL